MQGDTHNMPLAAVGNGPIMITNNSQMYTKRLSTGFVAFYK